LAEQVIGFVCPHFWPLQYFWYIAVSKRMCFFLTIFCVTHYFGGRYFCKFGIPVITA
jgi:hypothetical protein